MSDKPGAPAPEQSASQAAPPAEAQAEVPVEEPTQPHKLKDLAPKLAKKRRRTTAAELLVKRPKQAEVRVPLDRMETTIGRDPGCDIVLTDDNASRRHAKIQRGDGGFFEVVDLGSSNGVLVDGARVERMTLLDGDAFQIGETQFKVIVGPMLGAEAG